MSISIRSAVIANFQNATADEIRESIEGGLQSSDEVVLPGLGVLLECYYKNLDDTQKQVFATDIKNSL